MRYSRLLFAITFCLMLLAACGETVNTPVPTPPPTQTPMPIPTEVFPTPTPVTPLPTFTPFRPPPTATSTPYILPTYTPVPVNSSLGILSQARGAFKEAYAKAFSRIEQPGAALVLAQTNQFGTDHITWNLYFVKSDTEQMWVVAYDSVRGILRVDDTQKPILLSDVGQIDITKTLDSNIAAQRLVARGFSAQTPVDTFILQLYQTQDNKRIPAWFAVSSAYNRQVVLNAYSGDIMENNFNR
ncbi:MAG: hypothetical protein HXX08_10600 [Chloroflexi bacterium]|uniref:PepSY domain-containing protein n=1 Tax=Candidatus Chlorohelix allophototropha TaxID=3003348 RepID=A0A8T7M3L8_9CHLR|nr:hypothetical protein [Chloroflexota bacterium]WJW65686.1 hypothetical protein OZ401_001464 [Chloroflexota bacterium L227-S17]